MENEKPLCVVSPFFFLFFFNTTPGISVENRTKKLGTVKYQILAFVVIIGNIYCKYSMRM